jgi:hypothetical protein
MQKPLKFHDRAIGALASLAASLCATMARTTYQPARPRFVVDEHSITRLSGRQINWALVGEDRRQTPGQIVTVGAAGAAIGATSIPVLALARALNAGTVLDFGLGKFATVTANAPAGAVAITVRAIPTAVVSGDVATVAGTGAKFLPAGTVIGTLLDGTGKASPRIVTTNPAVGILETNATDDPKSADSSTGYGVIVGGVIFENLLPEATGTPKVLATAVKTELVAAGTGFAFQQYADSRT